MLCFWAATPLHRSLVRLGARFALNLRTSQEKLAEADACAEALEVYLKQHGGGDALDAGKAAVVKALRDLGAALRPSNIRAFPARSSGSSPSCARRSARRSGSKARRSAIEAREIAARGKGVYISAKDQAEAHRRARTVLEARTMIRELRDTYREGYAAARSATCGRSSATRSSTGKAKARRR